MFKNASVKICSVISGQKQKLCSFSAYFVFVDVNCQFLLGTDKR